MENKFKMENISNEYNVNFKDMILKYNMNTDELSVTKKYSERTYEKDEFNKNGEIKNAIYSSKRDDIDIKYMDIYKDNKRILQRRENEVDYRYPEEYTNGVSFVSYIQKEKENDNYSFTLFNNENKISKLTINTKEQTFTITEDTKPNEILSSTYDKNGRKIKEKIFNEKTKNDITAYHFTSNFSVCVKRYDGELSNLLLKINKDVKNINVLKLDDELKNLFIKEGIITEKDIEIEKGKIEQKKEKLFRHDEER